MNKLLIISNGHGEDIVAQEIIKTLPENIEVSVLPLVGAGKTFTSPETKLVGSCTEFPGGGFSIRNPLALLSDIRAGYFENIKKQWETINSLKGKYDLTVSIGDFVPLFASYIIGAPFIFIGVNKTDYYHTYGYSYTFVEKILLKKAAIVFTRDQLTADNLKKSNIFAKYAGNPLMDCIGESALKDAGKYAVGFLPGTRKEDIPLNIEDFEIIAKKLKTFNPNFVFSIATEEKAPKEFVKKTFADVLYNSQIIVGLSGTGNEQAAGLGKPVVVFYGRGSQYNKRFANAQKELLGEALSLTEKSKTAGEIWSILNDHSRYNLMSKFGEERMGKPGAIKEICKEIK